MSSSSENQCNTVIKYTVLKLSECSCVFILVHITQAELQYAFCTVRIPPLANQPPGLEVVYYCILCKITSCHVNHLACAVNFCDLIILVFLHTDVWNNLDIRGRKVAKDSGHPRSKLGANKKGKGVYTLQTLNNDPTVHEISA